MLLQDIFTIASAPLIPNFLQHLLIAWAAGLNLRPEILHTEACYISKK
jgi:hypothetical protein